MKCSRTLHQSSMQFPARRSWALLLMAAHCSQHHLQDKLIKSKKKRKKEERKKEKKIKINRTGSVEEKAKGEGTLFFREIADRLSQRCEHSGAYTIAISVFCFIFSLFGYYLFCFLNLFFFSVFTY